MAIQRALHRPHYLVASGAVQQGVLGRRRSRSSPLLVAAGILGSIWLVVALLDWGLPAL